MYHLPQRDPAPCSTDLLPGLRAFPHCGPRRAATQPWAAPVLRTTQRPLWGAATSMCTLDCRFCINFSRPWEWPDGCRGGSQLGCDRTLAATLFS